MLFRVYSLAVFCTLSVSARFHDILWTHKRLCLDALDSPFRKRRDASEFPEQRVGGYIKCCGYCSTDEGCFYMGSCCLKEYNTFQDGIRILAQNRFSCVGLDDRTKERYWMGTKCPPGTDAGVKLLCENSDVRSSFESIFPVTDSSVLRSYKNRYCAICDGVDLHPLAEPWKVEISCNDFIPTATGNLLSTLQKENCDIFFQAPRLARHCELPPYTISECNKTGKWSVYDQDIDLACNSFIDPFNYTYKNYFCYVCNTDKELSPRQMQHACPDPFQEMTTTIPEPKFTMVLELNSIREMEAAVVLNCDTTTHFVDFKKMVCREIFCSIGHRRSAGQCLPDVAYNQRLCVALYFQLTLSEGPMFFSDFETDAYMDYFQQTFIKHIMVDSDSVKEFLIFLNKNSTTYYEELNEFVIYMVIQIPANDLNSISNMLQKMQSQFIYLDSDISTAKLQITFDQFNMQITQSEPLEAEVYVTRTHENKSSIFSLFHRGQVLSEDKSRHDDATCLRTELILFNKVLTCAFVKINIKDIHMSIRDGILTSDLKFGGDIAFTRWMYERHGEDIHLCLTDYETIFRFIPMPVVIATASTDGVGGLDNLGQRSTLYLFVILLWYYICTL